jgi:DNA-binding response OmpR family regulator
MYVDDFIINTLGRKVIINGKEIGLTAKEFDLLILLATNPGKVFNREELLEIIWGYEYYGDLRTVDVHVRRLREKIEKDSNNYEYVLTKWGVGYYFRNRT